MSHRPKSYLPWYGTDSYESFGRRFTSTAAKTKTILDEWRVAVVKHNDAKTLYEETDSTDDAAMEALKEQSENQRRQVAEIVECMKTMDSFAIYNDKHLWLVFRFFFQHSHKAHVDMGPELEDDYDKEALQFLSGEFFRTKLPHEPTRAFDDGYVTAVEVHRINWAYYDNEDNH